MAASLWLGDIVLPTCSHSPGADQATNFGSCCEKACTIPRQAARMNDRISSTMLSSVGDRTSQRIASARWFNRRPCELRPARNPVSQRQRGPLDKRPRYKCRANNNRKTEQHANDRQEKRNIWVRFECTQAGVTCFPPSGERQNPLRNVLWHVIIDEVNLITKAPEQRN